MKMLSRFELLYRLRITKVLLEDKKTDDNKVKEQMNSFFNKEQLKELCLSWDMEPRFRRNILLIKVEEEIYLRTQELFAYPCDKRWDSLQNTENPDVKYCNECRKNVYLALDDKELIKRQELKQCIHVRPKIHDVSGIVAQPLTGILHPSDQ